METEEKLNREIENFNGSLVPFGYLDIKEAVKIAIEVGEDGYWAGEQIKEYMDSCGINDFSDIDPVYCVLDSVFQFARNKIDEVLNVDIENDLGFYTHGNFMCSSIDYKTENLEELQKRFNEATEEQKEELKEDKFFMYLADQTGLETDLKL